MAYRVLVSHGWAPLDHSCLEEFDRDSYEMKQLMWWSWNHSQAAVKLNVCTSSYIPELAVPLSQTSYFLHLALFLQNTFSQALTSHAFSAYRQSFPVSEGVLALICERTDFNMKLKICWISRLFTRSWLHSTAVSVKPNHRNTSETAFYSIYQAL